MLSTGLVIEDHPLSQQWLSQGLTAAFPEIEIALAEDCESALAHLESHGAPEIALIDLNLPDGNGRDLIQVIKSKRPLDKKQSLCVVATIFDDDQNLFESMAVGADGYILKDQAEVSIAESLKQIHLGYPPMSPSISRRLLGRFRRTEHTESLPNLTPREEDVLACIAKGYSMREAADMLGISYHTVCGYAKDIYKKLNINSRAEATLEAVKHGIVRFSPP